MSEDAGLDAAPPAWPPPHADSVFVPGLPSPAFVVSRLSYPVAVTIIGLPILLYGAYFRLLRAGVPLSRLVNPGVIGVVAVTVIALAVVLGPRAGQPTVLGGPDWVAGRGLFSRAWRMVPLAQADRFSSRTVRTRSGSRILVTIVGPAGNRVSLSFPATDPGAGEVLAALRTTGAHEVPRTELRLASRARATVVTTAIVAFAVLPMVYLELGPLRVLPRAVAGQFTWSGCRAALAAEDDRPATATTFVTNPLVAGGEPWRLLGESQLDAAEFAQHTENPTDRLAHLRHDAFVRADQAFLQDPAGHVVAYVALRFATPAGALAYDRYVNRAVCEHEYGRHGPRSTEVRMFHGTSALVRWVTGSTVNEVVQTPSHPFATRAAVYAVAQTLVGG